VNDDTLTVRFAALADSQDDSDWLDVVRRAGDDRGRSRAWLAVPIAAALVALVVGSAFAYYRDAIDFFGAAKAPNKVEDFESLSVGAPAGMDPQAIASEARRIEIATLGGESITLFLASTKAGGYCASWRNGGGGCDQLGLVPLNVGWWANGAHGNKPASAGITVSVAPYVESLELRFADGEVLTPPITWVSEPIDRGFAFYEYRSQDAEALTGQGLLGRDRGSGTGAREPTVVALDADGRLVAQEAPCCERAAQPPPEADLSRKDVAASIATRSGQATIWTAPTRYGATCAWLEFEGRTKLVQRCMPAGYGEDGMGLGTHPTTETVVLLGTVPERYGSLVLRYADGASQRVPLDGRFVLHEIPQSHLQPETRLRTVTVNDEDGRLITTLSGFPATGTTWAPCNRVLPLPPGQTCP
jgi:hypothetical protein